MNAVAQKAIDELRRMRGHAEIVNPLQQDTILVPVEKYNHLYVAAHWAVDITDPTEIDLEKISREMHRFGVPQRDGDCLVWKVPGGYVASNGEETVVGDTGPGSKSDDKNRLLSFVSTLGHLRMALEILAREGRNESPEKRAVGG